MPKNPSANYTATGTQFPVVSGTGNALAKEDFYTLQKAVEEHTHASTRGLPVRQVDTSNAPAAAGQVQVNNDDLRWWAAVAAAIRTAAAIENANTWTGQQRFNQPVLLPAIATPGAPGAGLTVVYAKSDGLLYRRSGGAGSETPVGTPPGLAFPANAMRTLGTPGTWAEPRTVTLSLDVPVLTFDGAAHEQADFNFAVPPGYTGTPISFLIQWRTSATTGNAAFRVDGAVTGTGGDLAAGLTTIANQATFAAQGTTNRKNLSTLSWTATLPAANDSVQCRFFRRGADAADTIDGVDLDVLSLTVAFG